MKKCYILKLADGTNLAISAEDEAAGEIISVLSRTTRLSHAPDPLLPQTSRLCVFSADSGHANCVTDPKTTVCVLEDTQVLRYHPREPGDPTVPTVTRAEWAWRQFVRISSIICSLTHSRGGILLHGGLIQCPPGSGSNGLKERTGSLLAGCSGVGKTTASVRFPKPWRALSDDLTLVVRDKQGVFWAHPWPTWSEFLYAETGTPGPGWNVQRAVQLQAIFFLTRGEGRMEPVGTGQALCLLTELSQQASRRLLEELTAEGVVEFNRQCFENLSNLAKTIPGYLLHMSLGDPFWEKIEKVLRKPSPE